MQSSGFDSYCEQLDAESFKAGCSSIAFGATPVCPCGMSKKPTPMTVPLPLRSVKRLEEGWPQARPASATEKECPLSYFLCFLDFVCLHFCTDDALSVGPPVKAVTSEVAHFFFLQRAIT